MVGSGKTYFVCNLLHGSSSISKKLDSPHDSQIVYIIAETYARLIEQTAQITHRESEMSSQLRHLQILMQMLLQICQNRMQTASLGMASIFNKKPISWLMEGSSLKKLSAKAYKSGESACSISVPLEAINFKFSAMKELV